MPGWFADPGLRVADEGAQSGLLSLSTKSPLYAEYGIIEAWMRATRKPLAWVGSSLEDLSGFPDDVKYMMGYALHLAQIGEKHQDARPLRGFRGAGVLEVVDDSDGDTYRAVYTVKLAGRVYVLHAFQKKSAQGIKTSHRDIDLIRQRLRQAEELHREWDQKTEEQAK